jgi:hypothetical protein
MIVSFLVGFAAYWACQRLYPAIPRWLLMTGAIILAAVVIVGGAWLLLCAKSGMVKNVTAQLGSGGFARMLLGLILGVAAGYVTDQKIQLGGVPLTIAGVILLLAIAAPHVDGWLSRLSGLKTSIIEIQLTSLSSASKSVQPVQREQFIRDFNLRSLSRYDEAIENDIKFIEVFEIPDLQERMKEDSSLQKRLDDLTVQSRQLVRLKDAFETYVSRAAKCFLTATENGLSIYSAQRALTELADKLTALSVREREEEGKPPGAERDAVTSKIKQLDDEIRDSLIIATKGLSPYVPAAAQAQCAIKQEDVTTPFPRHREFGDVPHLSVARAFLLLFVNNDRLGMTVLQNAANAGFKDYSTPRMLALLMYYEGDSVLAYYGILNDLRLLAVERQDIIKRVNERCGSSCKDDVKKWTPKLKLRARNAEINAINLIAYGTAVDVTDGRKDAETLLPIAEDYVEVLQKAGKDSDLHDDAYLDTAAFVTIVAEAQRGKTSTLNKEKIKGAVDQLEKITAREEMRISEQLKERSKNGQGERIDYSNLKTARAHLGSARGLLD